MKNFWILNFVLGSALSFQGCAGDKATLEEAEYKLSKGGAENAEAALSLMGTLRTSTSGEEQFEAYRLWAGAKMQAAGFDGLKIISTLVYKDSDNTIALIRTAVALNSHSSDYLNEVDTELAAFVASAAFTGSTDTRLKTGIRFQIGLANLFSAIRTAMTTGGVPTTGVVNIADCERDFGNAQADLRTMKADLNSSNSELTTGAGLNAQNPLVKLVDSFNTQVPDGTGVAATDAHIICQYLYEQSRI